MKKLFTLIVITFLALGAFSCTEEEIRPSVDDRTHGVDSSQGDGGF